MHRTALLFGAICFILVGAAAFFTATQAVRYLESQTETQLESALNAAGQDWANLRADGLKVNLTGLAPDEGSRFRALEIMGKLIETNRINDDSKILQLNAVEPPRFTLEVLRNETRISLIGLIPFKTGREGIINRLSVLEKETQVTDMLETADHQIPSGWNAALEYGLASLERLPRSKISISPERVKITAVTESVLEQRNIEVALRADKPDNLILILDISAPRPVISPFRFRMSIESGRVDLSSCSVDTTANRERVLRAAISAGAEGPGRCNIGLGVPTTDWATAVIQSISSLKELGAGTVTFTDSDISLVSGDDISQSDFDRIVGSLERRLPDLFSLHAILPPKPLEDGDANRIEVPRFTARKNKDGDVILQGRIPNAITRSAVGTYAGSLFGAKNITNESRVSNNLPDGWPLRVLAGLDALSQVHTGWLRIEPDTVFISGVAPRPDTTAEISRILSVRIGAKGNYKIDVKFDPSLFVVDEVPSHPECETGISAALARQQIKFDAGSVTVEKASFPVLDEIAEILRKCPDAKFNIEGHTDSQGSDELNKGVSQSRAESVLTALLTRRVLTSGLTAVGYGEEQPIADNETEEGRDRNRRIVFTLTPDEPTATAVETETAEEDTTLPIQGDSTDGQN